MTATLVQQEAIQSIADAVLRHTQALCEALRQNYIDYSLRSHRRSFEIADDDFVQIHHMKEIDKLIAGISDYEFTIETGRKYHKIILNARGSRSVHAFIDKKTGEVYKSATWKTPAKGVRYDLRVIIDREYLFEHADWAGAYLYAR